MEQLVFSGWEAILFRWCDKYAGTRVPWSRQTEARVDEQGLEVWRDIAAAGREAVLCKRTYSEPDRSFTVCEVCRWQKSEKQKLKNKIIIVDAQNTMETKYLWKKHLYVVTVDNLKIGFSKMINAWRLCFNKIAVQ